MKILIEDIIASLDDEAPFSLAEDWDNVGLLVGSRKQQANSVLIGLDPTNALLDEAISRGADTLLTHHPVIFHPLARIDTASPEGKLLEKALSHRIAIIACHTNLDSAAAGVSDILAASLGLTDLSPLAPAPGATDPRLGLGRIGHFSQPLAATDFIRTVLDALDLPAIQVAGPLPETVRTVAVCGGSGSDFAATAMAKGADVYLTAEVKHNVARWAEENGFCIIDGTHYATEQAAVRLLAEKLERLRRVHNWTLDILQTTTERHPFAYLTRKNSIHKKPKTGEAS